MTMRSFAAAVALLGVCGGLSPVAAQKTKPPQVRPRAPNRQNRPPKAAQNPAQELDRFEKMSPKDRQKALEKLPPARRSRIRSTGVSKLIRVFRLHSRTRCGRSCNTCA